jgi:glycine/D-amino acid oxidase-like deaminating enzyme
MKRVFGDYAYGDGPRDGCWWDETCGIPSVGTLAKQISVDVAIIGGGFTGLSAALRLAEKGLRVAVLEAHEFGWGASGRNGGFCCLGGAKASDAEIDARHGRAARIEFRQAERAAVTHVDAFLSRYGVDVDRHSNGETALAHRPKDMSDLRRGADAVMENYGVEARIIERQDLAAHGMVGGPFFGAVTIPIGFGINPRKYLAGLVSTTRSAGGLLYRHSPVVSMSKTNGRHRLETPQGNVDADQVIVATNGYSSEDCPPWIAGRYMPAQSTVIVTRPLRKEELHAQGWTTGQMSYDTRNLLHYFRLMPDRRFLFGMRGGLLSNPRAEASARARTRADFERMFPRWRHVESPHAWSGMVSLARNKMPFVGEMAGGTGIWAALCFHGNGVAMGSYAGRMVADLVMKRDEDSYPSLLKKPMARFPLGALRRVIMPPLYAWLAFQDRC